MKSFVQHFPVRTYVAEITVRLTVDESIYLTQALTQFMAHPGPYAKEHPAWQFAHLLNKTLSDKRTVIMQEAAT